MVRLIGFPTRETNSSHAASSQGPAQRQTTSFRDKDEYRVVLGVLGICYFWSDSMAGDSRRRLLAPHRRALSLRYQNGREKTAVSLGDSTPDHLRPGHVTILP